MVGMFRPQPNAGAVIQPKPALLCLFLQDFKPFPPPDPLDHYSAVVCSQATRGALVIYVPAAVVQHSRDDAITVSSELLCQLDDVHNQSLLIRQAV